MTKSEHNRLTLIAMEELVEKLRYRPACETAYAVLTKELMTMRLRAGK